MKTDPPTVIYLQWNCEENDPSYGNPDPGDVTWCPDKIFSDDVRYIRDKRYGKRKANAARNKK